MKTSELIGAALDWAVAKALGTLGQKPSRCFDCKHYEERQGRDDAIQYCHHPQMDFVDGSEASSTWPSDYATHDKCPINALTAEPYSTDWSQGGPIIEREFIELTVMPCGRANTTDTTPFDTWLATMGGGDQDDEASGPTPLIAAMRCFVASRLGDEIDIQVNEEDE